MKRTVVSKMLSLLLCGLMLAPAVPAMAGGQAPVPVAVADFDNFDTSGEAADRSARHAERVRSFAEIVRDRLAGHGRFRVVRLTCPDTPCSAAGVPPETLLQAARQAGARLMVYGGIHKMSTLIQLGQVQAVDLERDALVVDRSFSFRGDSDEAFRRAAVFVLRYLEDVALDP